MRNPEGLKGCPKGNLGNSVGSEGPFRHPGEPLRRILRHQCGSWGGHHRILLKGGSPGERYPEESGAAPRDPEKPWGDPEETLGVPRVPVGS
eukprot:1429752-Pyramimonas_sp.AAC.1